MGKVYRATDTRLDRKVAVKITEEKFSGRFEREARAISAFNHPHICTLYDVGPNYLVMELLEGTTLADEIKKGPLPLEQVARYGSQIAAALAEAHAHGIVHRDLKPGNIMVTRHGVKVLDFGLAKMASAAGMTEANVVMGTPRYMAPEQVEGRESDARTDLFALGLALYEMTAGKLPFPGKSLGRMQVSGTSAPTPRLAHQRPEVPESLDALVGKLLEKDPAQRVASAGEAAARVIGAGGTAHCSSDAGEGVLTAARGVGSRSGGASVGDGGRSAFVPASGPAEMGARRSDSRDRQTKGRTEAAGCVPRVAESRTDSAGRRTTGAGGSSFDDVHFGEIDDIRSQS